MSSSTNPQSASNQDDPWEQLAEDLFGLEYGKEHGSREPSSAAAEPVARPPAAAPHHEHIEERHEPVSATAPVETEPPHRHAERSIAVEAEFGESISFEEVTSSEKYETS